MDRVAFILSRPKTSAFPGADNKWPLEYFASETSGACALRSFIRNYILILLFTVYSLQFTVGCTKRETGDIHKETVQPVSVASVNREDLQECLFYSGDIEAQDEAIVYSKVGGKLAQDNVQEGDAVTKDQILALVDRDEVGYEFELAPVTAPIKGIVGRTYLDKGANITLQTPIALVVNIDEVRVKIDVTEKDLPKVAKGLDAQVKVDAYPDEIFEGQIEKVSPVLDLDTRTAPAWINITNPEHRLKPGMFARIKLMVGEHKAALVVLRDAIIEEDSQRYVFVVENNRAYKRKVELGLSADGRYEVLKGLKLADKVIVIGPSDLKDASPVKIVEE